MDKEKGQIVEEYKFFSKPLLIEANEAAHREKRNKCINPKKIEELSIGSIFYVLGFIYHRDNELRLRISLTPERKFELLDISITRYYSLPTIQFYEDGSYNIKTGERPYPNGRQWQESEVKKPLRKQSKFRKKILQNYNHTCALCEINEKSLLRAAHILDVKHGGMETEDNGICLCINHETGFDRGIIIINSDFSVVAPSGIGITVNKLKLPVDTNKYPSIEKLEKKKILIEKNKNYR